MKLNPETRIEIVFSLIFFIPSKIANNFDYKFYTAITRVQEKLFIINLSERYKKFVTENFKA